MSKAYAIELDSRRRLAVKISMDEFVLDQEGHYLGYPIAEMIEWCSENDCGYRIAYDMFAFKNQKDLTMFLLRWQ